MSEARRVRVRGREGVCARMEREKMRVPRKLNRTVLAMSYLASFSVGKPTWQTTSPPKVSTPLVRLLVKMGLLAIQREYIPAIFNDSFDTHTYNPSRPAGSRTLARCVLNQTRSTSLRLEIYIIICATELSTLIMGKSGRDTRKRESARARRRSLFLRGK